MKKWLDENKWPFEVSMSLRGICPEILQHPRKQVTSTQGGEGEEKKKSRDIFSFTISYTHFIKKKKPQGSKHLLINTYQQQHQKQEAKVKSKFIDDDEL